MLWTDGRTNTDGQTDDGQTKGHDYYNRGLNILNA